MKVIEGCEFSTQESRLLLGKYEYENVVVLFSSEASVFMLVVFSPGKEWDEKIV